MHEDFKRLRREGKLVKRYSFNQRMRQPIREHYSDSIEEFSNSNQWFARFCCRFKVSLRRKTHTQHKKVSRSRNYSSQIQTGSLFITDDKTYKTTNSKDV